MTPERKQVVDLLKFEMDKRQNKNPSYSLRAFARDLQTSPAIISLVLQGKRAVTAEKAIAWSEMLKLTSETKETLLRAVTEDLSSRLDPVLKKTRAINERIKYNQLKHDEFSLISDWWHLALMNLAKVDNFVSDVKWMSSKLSISVECCDEALERLARLGLMTNENGQWQRTSMPLETSSQVPSEAIRSFHRQNIRRALLAVDKINLDERDISSIMVVVDKTKLAEAKKRIQLFRKELAEFLGDGQGDEVYSLNVQLFPQSVPMNEDK